MKRNTGPLAREATNLPVPELGMHSRRMSPKQEKVLVEGQRALREN